MAKANMTKERRAEALAYLLNLVNEADGGVGSLYEAKENGNIQYACQEQIDAMRIVEMIIERVNKRGMF